ncbi:transcription factor TFIIIC tau55-related [Fusarium albosuccineum]|uniref:Transcription factor TFIIIC tau55-related n=1 Tax=Fusarium albosuccineum TaxID=1237068 RepID=A0A8H4KWL1_9HYPO|nr:transcription factor TFIIIC tau55-related [Fusarium albosuccineum]
MASSLDETRLADAPAVLSIQEQLERDEQEEWEYEYSTTENETYYLALELSYPEFKDRQSRVPHHSRGGYYKNWLDHNPTQTRGSNGQENQGDNDDDNDNEPLPEPEADDDEPEIDPELNNDKGKGVDAGETRENGEKTQDDTEDIQILELHSQKPVIAYKGRVFEGQWAEIIGTEAIFATRDGENSLPALRHLDGNVDFLGACASRITTAENVVKPRVSREDPLAAIREEWNIRIPVGKDRSGERAQQTRFLENLIALKKQKGETDHVTVWAKDGEGKDFKDNRDPDYKPRRRRRMLNEDGEEVVPKRERRRASGRRGGRPRLRAGRGRGRRAITAAPSATRDYSSPLQEGALSTPTPGRWDDLYEKEDDGRDEDEDNDGRSDTDEDGDMSMAD